MSSESIAAFMRKHIYTGRGNFTNLLSLESTQVKKNVQKAAIIIMVLASPIFNHLPPLLSTRVYSQTSWGTLHSFF